MAKTNERTALSGELELERAVIARLAGFYSGCRRQPGSYRVRNVPGFDRQNSANNYLNQERFFSAHLGTATHPTRDWQLFLTARPRQTARSKPPLSS
jgi:hypothetical protein